MKNAELYLGEPVPEGVAEVLLELRERSLYVEVFHDGRVLTPRGLVDPGQLDGAVVRGWIGWLNEVASRLRTEWMAGGEPPSSEGPP